MRIENHRLQRSYQQEQGRELLLLALLDLLWRNFHCAHVWACTSSAARRTLRLKGVINWGAEDTHALVILRFLSLVFVVVAQVLAR